MKLYGSGASPFVRMTRIVLGELGLQAKVQFVLAEGGPLDPPGERAKNPLKKIPFLEFDDGRIALDSRVVCEALLSEAAPDRAAALLPTAPAARLEVLTRQALAIGMADLAVASSYEQRLRPLEKQWPEWLDLQWSKIASGLDTMDDDPPPSGRFDLGDCAWVSLLAYLDFRFDDRSWRSGRLALATWFESVRTRPSMTATL